MTRSNPDLKGQWRRVGPQGFNGTRFDPSKPPGRGQEAPLTAEYQSIFEANLKDQAEGGQGTTPTYTCLSPGMPRATNGYGEIEFVVTPDTTHILVQHINDDRRIFTDGRDWPAGREPTFLGYSIGKWIDTSGAGRYDLLEVETRHLKGPRPLDPAGRHSAGGRLFGQQRRNVVQRLARCRRAAGDAQIPDGDWRCQESEVLLDAGRHQFRRFESQRHHGPDHLHTAREDFLLRARQKQSFRLDVKPRVAAEQMES